MLRPRARATAQRLRASIWFTTVCRTVDTPCPALTFGCTVPRPRARFAVQRLRANLWIALIRRMCDTPSFGCELVTLRVGVLVSRRYCVGFFARRASGAAFARQCALMALVIKDAVARQLCGEDWLHTPALRRSVRASRLRGLVMHARARQRGAALACHDK